MSQVNLNGNSFDDNNGKNSKRSNVSVKRLVLNINKDKGKEEEQVVHTFNNNNESLLFSQTFNPNLSNANLDYIVNAIKEEEYSSIPKLSYENVSKGKENIPINSQKNINSNEKDVKLSYSNKESSISKSNESLKIEKQIHLSPPKSKVSSSIKNISSSKSNMSNSKEKSNSKNIPLEKPKSKKSYSEMKANIYGAYTENINDMYIIYKHYDKSSNTKWILDLEDIVKDKLLFDQEVKNFTIKPVGGVGQFISRMWKFWVLYHSYCLQKTKIPLNIFIREVRQSHYNILDNKFLFEENIVDLIQKHYSIDEIKSELLYLYKISEISSDLDNINELNNEVFTIFFTHSVYDLSSNESQNLISKNPSYSYFYNEMDKARDLIDSIYTNYLLKKSIWKDELKEIYREYFKIDYENYSINPKDIQYIEEAKRFMSFYKFWILSFILMFNIVPISVQNIRRFLLIFTDSLSRVNCVSREYLIVFLKEVCNLIPPEAFSYEIEKLKKQLSTKEYTLTCEFNYEKAFNISQEIKELNANDWINVLDIYSNLELNTNHTIQEEKGSNLYIEDSKMNAILLIIDEYYNKFLLNDFTWMNELQSIIKYYFEWQNEKWCFKPRFINHDNNSEGFINEDALISMNLLKDYRFLLLVCFFHENQYETGIKLFLLFTYNISSFCENFENFIINYPRVLLLLFQPNIILEELAFIQAKYLKNFSQNYQSIEEVNIDYITIKDYITMLDGEYMSYIDNTYKEDYINSIMKQKRCMYNDQPKNINDNYISIIDTHIISSKKYLPEEMDEKNEEKQSITVGNSVNKFDSQINNDKKNLEEKKSSSKKKVIEEIQNYNINHYNNSNDEVKTDNYVNMDIRKFSTGSSKKKNESPDSELLDNNNNDVTFSIKNSSEKLNHLDSVKNSNYNTPYSVSNYKQSFGPEEYQSSNNKKTVNINIEQSESKQIKLSEIKENLITSYTEQVTSNNKIDNNGTPKINSSYKFINDPYSKFKKLLAPKKYPLDICSQVNDEDEDSQISIAQLQLERSQNLKVNKIFSLDKESIKDFPKDTHMYLTLLPNFVLNKIISHIKDKLINNSNQNSFLLSQDDTTNVSVQNVDNFTLNHLRKEFHKLSIQNDEDDIHKSKMKNDKKSKATKVSLNDNVDNTEEIDVDSYFKNKKRYKSKVKSKNFVEDLNNDATLTEKNDNNVSKNNHSNLQNDNDNRKNSKSKSKSKNKNKKHNKDNIQHSSNNIDSESEKNHKDKDYNISNNEEIHKNSTKITKYNKYNKYKVSCINFRKNQMLP